MGSIRGGGEGAKEEGSDTRGDCTCFGRGSLSVFSFGSDRLDAGRCLEAGLNYVPRRRLESQLSERSNMMNAALSRSPMFAWALCISLAVVTLATGCAPAAEPAGPVPPSNSTEVGLDNLNATLWMQTAVEYRATSLQAFRLGKQALDVAMADSSWTAALEQTGDFGGLPPAVILDLDETVLDNSFFEARLTLDGDVYSPELWDAWVLQEAATVVPGADEFLSYAAQQGITIFYVTNRREHLREATIANLEALGLPLSEAADTLMMRGQKPEWDSSNKTPRRTEVAENYRILLMFGDNMGDFTGAADGSVAERAAFAEEHADYWGTRWITLANPTYGSFIGAVLDNDYSMTPEQQVEAKKQALDPKR